MRESGLRFPLFFWSEAVCRTEEEQRPYARRLSHIDWADIGGRSFALIRWLSLLRTWIPEDNDLFPGKMNLQAVGELTGLFLGKRYAQAVGMMFPLEGTIVPN